MVDRAEPFPEPPPELKDDTFTFTVPVFFKRLEPPPVNDKWLKSWIYEQTKRTTNSPPSEMDDARLNAKLHSICRGC